MKKNKSSPSTHHGYKKSMRRSVVIQAKMTSWIASMNFNTEGLHPSFINTGMKRMQRLETRYAKGLKRIFQRLHKLRCSGKMERCKLLQANPGKNRWAKRIDFETRHTFIDDLVV